MTLRSRRRWLYFLSALFLVLGGGTVLYAQGWRVSLFPPALNKVGAIYIRPYPKDADISLNGLAIKSSSGIFSAGTLINNLFPKNYSLIISEPGYYSWQETVTVNPALVTELKHVVLVPKDAAKAFTAAANKILMGGKSLLVLTASGKLTVPIENKTLAGNDFVGATDDGRTILTLAAGNYWLNNLDTGEKIDINALLGNAVSNVSQFKPRAVAIDPGDGNHLLAEGERSLFSVNVANGVATELFRAPAGKRLSVIAASPARLAVLVLDPLTGISQIAVSPDLTTKLSMGKTTIEGRVLEVTWINSDALGILTDKGDVDVYTPESDATKTLARDTYNFSPSPDGKLVAALGSSGIEIFSLGDGAYSRFNIPSDGKPIRLSWYYDSEHIFTQYPQTVRFLDINDHDLADFITIASTTAYAYAPEDNIFYFRAGRSINKIAFPRD